MMVRTLRTGKGFPLRLDKLPQERRGDHRNSKWRESMTVTTNRRWAVRVRADRGRDRPMKVVGSETDDSVFLQPIVSIFPWRTI
jgi:hypothetical protein